MNNSGQIVGLSYNGFNPALNQGFLYQNGTMTSLTSLLPPSSGWTVTQGISINDNGQILAFANDPTGSQHEILLTPPSLDAPPDAVFPPTPVPEPSMAVVFSALAVGLAVRRWCRSGRRSRRLITEFKTSAPIPVRARQD